MVNSNGKVIEIFFLLLLFWHIVNMIRIYLTNKQKSTLKMFYSNGKRKTIQLNSFSNHFEMKQLIFWNRLSNGSMLFQRAFYQHFNSLRII